MSSLPVPVPGLPPKDGSSQSYEIAEQNMEDAVNQLILDRAQMTKDLGALLEALEKMKEEIKNGHADIALMMAFTTIFPAIFQYKQDNMVQLADSENIASGLRSFVNNAATAFNQKGLPNNSPTDPKDDAAKDLYDNVTALSAWSQYLSTAQNGEWTSSTLPLDPTDAQNIKSSCDNIANQFTADWGNTAKMNSDMVNWYTAPTDDGKTPPAEPATQIKAIQGALQTSNSAVSTLATTTQTQEQFYTNEYNQITGITNSLQQSQATQTGTLVHNQKAG
jgi:hypothetical protein